MTEDINKNYDERDKVHLLSVLKESKTTIDLIEDGINDIPSMKVDSLSYKRSNNIAFTRKYALPDTIETSILIEVKDNAGKVIDTIEEIFPADTREHTINIIASSNKYPKDDTVLITSYYIVNGSKFLIASEECECISYNQVPTTGLGNVSNGLNTKPSSGTTTGPTTGGTNFPASSDNEDEPQDVPPTADELFTDIEKYDWAKEAIEELYYAGIINGMEDGIFNPAGLVTREQFSKMVVQLFGLNVGGTRTQFLDINEHAWYAPYIVAATQAGYIQGQSNEYFGIGESIMRQDMATILYRALGDQNSKVVLQFTDNDAIASYSNDAISELVGLEIINGYEDGSFKPRGTATRAEAAKMIYGVYTYINN